MSSSSDPSPALRGDDPAAASASGYSDRAELASISVERARMPMVVTDPRQPDNPIVLANKAFLNLSGYTADEVIGRNCRLLQGADTSPLAIAELRAGVAQQREVSVELLNYRKDGSSFWNQLELSPIHDDSGALIYYFGSQIDVGYRQEIFSLKVSESRLVHEIDHRTLNALAIVDSIVRLTPAESTGSYAAAVQRRVQSLAKAHHVLSEWRWRDIPLAALIQGQIEPFATTRIEIAGPDVLLHAATVQPLAFVIHELIANAVTHGALTRPTGSLRISWARKPASNWLELDWRETGGPAPSTKPAPGFGATMIGRIVQHQLRGAFSQKWNTDGLEARLSFPAPA